MLCDFFFHLVNILVCLIKSCFCLYLTAHFLIAKSTNSYQPLSDVSLSSLSRGFSSPCHSPTWELTPLTGLAPVPQQGLSGFWGTSSSPPSAHFTSIAWRSPFTSGVSPSSCSSIVSPPHSWLKGAFLNTSRIALLPCLRSFPETLPAAFKNTTFGPGSCGKWRPSRIWKPERLKKTVTPLSHQHTSSVNLGKSHNFESSLSHL